MKQFLVAIDGGGSKTEYLLAQPDGTVQKTIIGAPTSMTAYGLGQAAYNIREGLRQLLEDEPEAEITTLVLALAGLDTARDLAGCKRVFGEVIGERVSGSLVLVNDAIAALVAGTLVRPALVLIGGTGANCFGWTADGRHHQVSGLDYLLADDGSGYDAGRLAIKAAVRSFDGRGQETTLQKAVFGHFEVASAAALKDQVYNPAVSKDEIASFAKVVIEHARGGDEVARGIVDYCLEQLLLDVRAVTTKLELTDQKFPLVPTGSFLLALREEFAAKLQASHLPAQLLPSVTAPVRGALTIAQEIQSGRPASDFQFFA